MTIILVCHNMALSVWISHNLWKCDISDPILTLFLISECHQFFFYEIVIYFIALPLIAQTASIFQLTLEHNGVTLTLLAASQKPLVQLYPPKFAIYQITAIFIIWPWGDFMTFVITYKHYYQWPWVVQLCFKWKRGPVLTICYIFQHFFLFIAGWFLRDRYLSYVT